MESDPISKRQPEDKGISSLDKLRLAGVLAVAVLPGCIKIGDIKEYRQIVDDTFPKVGLSVGDTVVTKTLSECGSSGSVGVVDEIDLHGNPNIIFIGENCRSVVGAKSVDILVDR